jgi:hypothetical protein
MSQLTIQSPVVAPNGARRRPMRSERMVGLRSAMPLGLVTRRHDVPQYVTTTPKVDNAARSERGAVETPARKGGEAQW